MESGNKGTGYSMVLNCIVFDCIAWYLVVLHSIGLYCVVFGCIALYCIRQGGQNREGWIQAAREQGWFDQLLVLQ